MRKLLIGFLMLSSFATYANTIEEFIKVPELTLQDLNSRNINEAQINGEKMKKAWESAFNRTTLMQLSDYEYSWQVKAVKIYREQRRCDGTFDFPDCTYRQIYDHDEYYPEMKIMMVNTNYFLARIVYSAENYNCLQLKTMLGKDTRFAGIPFASLKECEVIKNKAIWKNITVAVDRTTVL